MMIQAPKSSRMHAVSLFTRVPATAPARAEVEAS